MIEMDHQRHRMAIMVLAAAHLLACGALIYPLIVVEMPPLLDYPIHVARTHILLAIDHNPLLASIYAFEWRPVPNLAIDLFSLALGPLMSAEVSGRFFLGLCLLMTVLGVAVLHRVNFGRWSWWTLLAAIPAYHGALTAGFVNFSFGLALVPLATALWLCVRTQPMVRQVLAHAGATTVLYFCHILALGLYALIAGAYEMSRWSSQSSPGEAWRDAARRTAVLTTPLLLAALSYGYVSMAEVLQRHERVLYGEWRMLPKIRGALMPVLTHNHALDAIALAALVVLPLALAWTRRLEIKPGFVLPILLILGLFLALPGHLMDSSFIMERLPVAAVLIAIGSTKPHGLPKRWITSLGAAVLILVVSRTCMLTDNWLDSATFYERAKAMSDHVEPGSSILIVSPFSSPEIHEMDLWRHRLLDHPDWHYALINIPALHSLPIVPLTKRAIFSQLHFVWPDKQILRLTSSYRQHAYGDGANATFSPRAIFQVDRTGQIRLSKRADGFRYILVLYPQHIPLQDLTIIEALDPVYASSDMLLIDRAKHQELSAKKHLDSHVDGTWFD